MPTLPRLRSSRYVPLVALIVLASAARPFAVQQPAPAPPAKTVLDEDHEFDGGSKIVLEDLTPAQIANLTTLGKVWGFLKYHHPAIAAGGRHWDYELFRVLPRVLAARDAAAARAAMHEWVAGLGPVTPCTACASLDEKELHLQPRTAWLTDERLGKDLGDALRAIHRNRPSGPQQFYVSMAPGVGNPRFDHEPNYEKLSLPDAGYQLLALYRLWNIVEYWFPYRDLIEGDWDRELTAFVPRIALARDADAYKLALMAFVAKLQDTHANLWSALAVRPPAGECHVPAGLRFVQDQAVVTDYLHETLGPATGLQIGDIVEAVDGTPVATLVGQWAPFYAASNQPTKMRDMARFMTRGVCGPAAIRVKRGSATVELKPERVSQKQLVPTRTNDRPGPVFQKLSPDVAYLKLSSVKAADAASYVESAAGTKGLVIDIRNYPSEFVVFALGSRLVEQPTPFARFTTGDPANPGAFRWTPPLSLQPSAPRYPGRIVILIDEASQSQSEYTTMAFRSAPNAVVVGSTTAGADGNVSPIPLPGGQRAMISGIGVFYPDKRPTQRIGIVPDIEARPTIEGIRSGRDEVLEVALRQILGPGAPASEIERLAKR
jgi:C-terminal processing protease CtpA/Prc